jgi:hypothetical protein
MVSSVLQNVTIGRIAMAYLPKKSNVYCSVLTHKKLHSMNSNNEIAKQNMCNSSMNQNMVAYIADAKSKLLGFSNSNYYLVQRNVTAASPIVKSKIEIINQLQSKTRSAVQMIGSTSILFSAHFIVDQLSISIAQNRAILPAVRSCLKLSEMNSNVQGIRVVCSGRFRGIDRARTLGYSFGQIKRQQFSSHVDYASKSILSKTGLVGIKVWVTYVPSSDITSHHVNSKKK